jgi:hypothetical protein
VAAAVLAEPLPAIPAQLHGEAMDPAEDESMELDLEDLDTPAFMRQGRLLN